MRQKVMPNVRSETINKPKQLNADEGPIKSQKKRRNCIYAVLFHKKSPYHAHI